MADPAGFPFATDPVSCRSCPAHPILEARLAAVRQLPALLLPIAMTDPEPAVRQEVARLIGEEWLAVMAWDSDAGVRLRVAARLRPEQLTVLVGDADVRVRAAVAHRAEAVALVALVEDRAEEVNRIARQRLDRLVHPSVHGWGAEPGGKRLLM